MKAEVTTGLYTIEQFMTNAGEPGDPSSRGFAIILNARAATAFLQMKREDGGRFVEELRQVIVRNSSVGGKYAQAPDFYRDTWLLTSIRLPSGTCACFFIDGGAHSLNSDVDAGREIRRDLRYSPHNLDTIEQAATVLGVWLYWFNTILSVTEFKQPHAL